jgi:GTP-binding protein
MINEKIRNIAIIAHVDHGKTTLVDKMILAGQLFKEHELTGDLILDNNDLERERGITILAKNVSITYKGTKINIIDTPGHSDFGGEVERVLNMCDGVLLLVDAFEGAMPQTRFVLQKAIQLGLKPIVIVNKVDKQNCTPDLVHEQVFDLMFALEASEEQLDFPVVFGSAKNNWMGENWAKQEPDITYLLDQIITHIPPPKADVDMSLQMLITSLDYSNYIGRIAVGRLRRGVLRPNMNISLVKRDGTIQKSRVKELYVFEGMGKIKTQEVQAGDICAVVGIEGFEIGDCIADYENPEALPTITIDEPTMSMTFTINDSPFFGQEGKFVTSRHIKDRLDKELEKNLALKIEQTDAADTFRVFGRGVLHLSVLIETMRREGYELQIGQPQVITKYINNRKHEPVEELNIDVPEDKSGTVIDLVTRRKGQMTSMVPKGDRMLMVFEIPSRGIIGLRSTLLTMCQGELVMTHRFLEFQEYKGEIPQRTNGSMISKETGEAIPYSINNLQDRGTFFVEGGDRIYMGMVIGENARPGDMLVNVTLTKKLTNMRASGSDDKMRLIPPKKFTLEEALEYIQEDELVEVTPQSIRLRKTFLEETDRKRGQKRAMEMA